MSVVGNVAGRMMKQGGAPQALKAVAGAVDDRVGRAVATPAAREGLRLSSQALARLNGSSSEHVATIAGTAVGQMARVPGHQRQADVGYEAIQAIRKLTGSPVAAFTYDAAAAAPYAETAAAILRSALERPAGLAAGLTDRQAAAAVADVAQATLRAGVLTNQGVPMGFQALARIAELVPDPAIAREAAAIEANRKLRGFTGNDLLRWIFKNKVSEQELIAAFGRIMRLLAA